MNMSKPFKSWLQLGLLSFCMASPAAVLAQDCAAPARGDLYTDKDAADSSDSNNGVLRSEGGTGPFKTIQKLVNTIGAGQCGWVKPAAVPYTETGRVSQQDYAGITFMRGGTSENARVIISGFPGTQPVIDQQRILPSGSWGAAGFLIASGSYITIRNFEIINSTASSIATTDAAKAKYITIENNHLHHSYVTENAGGVRLDFCDNCIVRNNKIHHHYNTFRTGQTNLFDSQPYALNAGVHGFQPGNCSIENNLIHNVAKGVFVKQGDADGLDAHKVSGNIFVNISETAYEIGLQGSGMPPANNGRFFNNIVYNAPVAVAVYLDSSSGQGNSLKVYNNTIINTRASIADVSNMTNVEVYNNLVYGTTNQYASYTGSARIFATFGPGRFRNSITYFDNNLYHGAGMSWGLYGTGFDSLSAWRAATHSELLYSNPDASSLVVNPGFVNAAGGYAKLLTGSAADYALSASSPALNAGRAGVTIGAVRNGVNVGLLDGAADTKAPPVAPTLQVDVN